MAQDDTPEDIGLVVANEEEAYWMKRKEENETSLNELYKLLKLQEAIKEMIDRKIEEAKEE